MGEILSFYYKLESSCRFATTGF